MQNKNEFEKYIKESVKKYFDGNLAEFSGLVEKAKEIYKQETDENLTVKR